MTNPMFGRKKKNISSDQEEELRDLDSDEDEDPEIGDADTGVDSERTADEAGAEDAEDEEDDNFLKNLQDQPEWLDEEEQEGQLSVDVYEEGGSVIVRSTIAGVEPDDLDISINNDMLTIRGDRKLKKKETGRNYYFQECYWGAFSRSIILPVEVDVKKIDATIQNGILTITLPKLKTADRKTIKVKDKN